MQQLWKSALAQAGTASNRFLFLVWSCHPPLLWCFTARNNFFAPWWPLCQIFLLFGAMVREADYASWDRGHKAQQRWSLAYSCTLNKKTRNGMCKQRSPRVMLHMFWSALQKVTRHRNMNSKNWRRSLVFDIAKLYRMLARRRAGVWSEHYGVDTNFSTLESIVWRPSPTSRNKAWSKVKVTRWNAHWKRQLGTWKNSNSTRTRKR